MINRSILVGRLTKDIDLMKTPNGASVVKFTLAVNRIVKAQGQPDADFISCVAWNKVADLMKQYLHKGSMIGVEGRIQTRSYDDKDGKRVYITEVIADSVQFLEPKGNAQPQQNTYQPQNNGYAQPQQNAYQPQNNGYSQGYSQNTYNAPQNQYNGYEPQNQGYEETYGLDFTSDDLPF